MERKKRGIPVPLLGKLDSMRLAAKRHNSFLLRLDHDNILGRENVRLLESKRQLNEIYKQMWTRKKHNILNITRTIWGSEWVHVGMGNSLLMANASQLQRLFHMADKSSYSLTGHFTSLTDWSHHWLSDSLCYIIDSVTVHFTSLTDWSHHWLSDSLCYIIDSVTVHFTSLTDWSHHGLSDSLCYIIDSVTVHVTSLTQWLFTLHHWLSNRPHYIADWPHYINDSVTVHCTSLTQWLFTLHHWLSDCSHYITDWSHHWLFMLLHWLSGCSRYNTDLVIGHITSLTGHITSLTVTVHFTPLTQWLVKLHYQISNFILYHRLSDWSITDWSHYIWLSDSSHYITDCSRYNHFKAEEDWRKRIKSNEQGSY